MALVGKQHSGKGEAADYLQVTHGFTRRALADPLKNDVERVLNTALQAYAKQSKSVKYPVITRELIEEHKDSCFRPFVRWFGDDFIRTFQERPDFWIEYFEDWLADHEGYSVVCDDVRYPNEADALRHMGFVIVKIVRDEFTRLASITAKQNDPQKVQESLAHRSEQLVDEIEADFTIYNDSIPSLHRTLNSLVKMCKPRYV